MLNNMYIYVLIFVHFDHLYNLFFLLLFYELLICLLVNECISFLFVVFIYIHI